MALIQLENWSEFATIADIVFKGYATVGRPTIDGYGTSVWLSTAPLAAFTASAAGKSGSSPAISLPMVLEQGFYDDADYGQTQFWANNSRGIYIPTTHTYNTTRVYSMWFKVSNLATSLALLSLHNPNNSLTRTSLMVTLDTNGNVACYPTSSSITNVLRSGVVSRNADLGNWYNAQYQGTLYGDTSGMVTPPVSADSWHFLELKYKPHTSTGTLEMRIDNQPCFTFNGATTRAVQNIESLHLSSYRRHTSINPDNVALVAGDLPNTTTAGIATDVLFDGIFITDDTGDTANDFLGPSTLYSLKPNSVADNGEGGQSQFTTVGAASQNAAVETVDGDTSYIQAVAPGNITFNYSDLPAVGSIIGMELNSFARRTGNDAKNLQYKLGAGETSAGSAQAIQSTYSPIRQILSINPATGNPWTKAEIDALQVKIETNNG